MIETRDIALHVAMELESRWPNLYAEGFAVEEAAAIIQMVLLGQDLNEMALCDNCGTRLKDNNGLWFDVGGFDGKNFFCSKCW